MNTVIQIGNDLADTIPALAYPILRAIFHTAVAFFAFFGGVFKNIADLRIAVGDKTLDLVFFFTCGFVQKM